MTKSSRTASSRKQSKHSSSYSDSETEIEIVDEEEREGRTRKTKKCKEESSVRVSYAGEKRRLGDGGDNRSRHGNDSEDLADSEQISSKRRRESDEKKNMKEKIADTERLSREEVRNRARCKVKYEEDADRDSRHKDAARYKAKYEEDAARDSRHKDAASYEVKYGEDADGNSRHRDSRSREDIDWKKRHREDRHKDEYALRDHHSDRSGSKHAKDESYAIESRYKKSRYDDGKQTRYNDDRGSIGDDRVDHDYSTSRSTKERHVDPENNNGGDTVYNNERRNRADDREDQAYSRSRSTKEQHVDPEKNDGGYTRYKDDRGNRADDRDDQNYSRSRSTKERHVDPEKNAGEFTRYNDDRGNRADDREDRSYSRSRSTKEQHFDPEKKVSGLAEPIADKEGSRLHHADADSNASCNRQRNSPSSYSHLSKDQSRPSVQAELKYGEPEEKVRQNFLPSTEVVDVSGVLEQPCLYKRTKRLIDKDDSSFGDLSVERDLISDESKPSTSPLDLPDNSKLTRSTGENYDSKTFGKSSGVKDTGSSCAEGKGSWQLPSKKLPTGGKFQEDSDVFSSSSSINAGQVPSNSYSNFHRPHNHYKRANRPNAGPVHGNARKGVPNRPSPLVSNFTHFQHGPVAVGFHPLMHQFPAFPMYSARPVMDINHPAFSHHVPDAGRYFSHGHQYGWQNPVDNSSYPPLPGRDANNVATRSEAPAYGTFDWNHITESIGCQQLETSADMLKGSTGGVHPELPSVSQEENPAVYAKEDENCLEVSRLQENQSDTHLDKGQKIEIGLDSDDLAKEPCKPSKSIAEKLPKLSKIPKDDDGHLWLVYLSRLDISAELTHPELYNKCLTLKDVEQNESIDEDSLELLCLEEVEKTQVELPKLASSASLFVAIDDSVFQRAMSFYKKQREETRAITHPLLIDGQQTSFYSAQKLDVVPICDRENDVVPLISFNELKQGQFFPACSAPHNKVDESAPVLSLEKSCEPSSRQVDTSMILDVETVNGCIKDRSPTLHNASQSAASWPGYLSGVCDFHSAGSTEEKKSLDSRSDHITVSKVSGEAFENVMSRSIEPVSLSRIHDALESTH
ncbi:hypothetical protein ABKV19_012291 [Rosa sericea]